MTDANYDCSYGYDGRGNFNLIQRNGFLGLNSSGIPQYGQLDNLTFDYTGANLLNKTTESANYTKGFLGSQSMYTYDKGRLITDSGKGVSVEKYNFLNQPQVINISSNPSVRNFWDANGNLHKQIQYFPGNVEKVRYYQDGIEYFTGPNDEILIESIHHGEGRYVYEYDENGKFKRNYHEFMISDHLGNVRVRFADLNGDGKINVVDEGPGQEKEILGSYHYYPYGMRMEGIFHPQDLVENMYRYNGIEYLDHQGLNVSLATWRTHDAAIGRWWQVDPLAEHAFSFNPFNSMYGDPVSYSDPEGDMLFIAVAATLFVGRRAITCTLLI